MPLNSVSKFQSLFQALEQSSQSINIEYVGISMTTLEEVFLKLGNDYSNKLNDNLSEKVDYDGDEKVRIIPGSSTVNSFN